ncbi:hypothetical protein SOHN41_02235 [Shewanella sp. HN-41]|nr:hypothetical protein SOHN41_02235 [Shewanella sp. HN-41]
MAFLPVFIKKLGDIEIECIHSVKKGDHIAVMCVALILISV